MSVSVRFLPVIPEGFQIFWGDVEIVGLKYRMEAVETFARGKNQDVYLKASPTNSYDVNAIEVHGTVGNFLGPRSMLLGYIPAPIAEVIADESLTTSIAPRLRNVYLGDFGGAIIEIDLIGPKSKFKSLKINQARKEVEASFEDGVFRIPRDNVDKNYLGMSCEDAGETDLAIQCYEACIKGRFDGNHPFDRLLAIYRKRKDSENELRIVHKAIRVFERVTKSGRSDGPSKLAKYQLRLQNMQR